MGEKKNPIGGHKGRVPGQIPNCVRKNTAYLTINGKLKKKKTGRNNDAKKGEVKGQHPAHPVNRK